jgi:putative redox protein
MGVHSNLSSGENRFMETITTHYKGNMLLETQMGKHTPGTAVPASMGGSDRGPQPPSLFVASLGSCIGAFVAEYCEKNGIDAAGMTVDIDFEKVPNPTRLVNMKATVHLPNGDCGKRIQAIERVAEHCPVHESIKVMNGLEIAILGKDDCNVAE